MAVSELSHEALAQAIHKEPDSDELFEELNRRIEDPSTADDIIQTLLDLIASQLPPDEQGETEVSVEPEKKKPYWENYIHEQKCWPKEIRSVKSLEDLIKAVQDARQQKLPARIVGHGHSYSEVCPTDGILLKPFDMNKTLQMDSSILKDPGAGESYFSVMSGMTIKDLNDHLEKQGRALETLGAYDGQTVAGAISTGTHGSVVEAGPLASLVCSIVLVSETGQVYQIEPADGITDPTKFQPGPHGIKLKQDDDWFQSALVAMGCLGLIYSYTLRVVPKYLLSETRTVTTWQAVKSQLSQGRSSDVFRNYYYEVLVNPYPTKEGNVAVTVIRNTPPPNTEPRGGRGLSNPIAVLIRLLRGYKLVVAWLNKWPKASPRLITRALKTLKNHDYVDKSYKVLNLGATNLVPAYALELSFNADDDIVATIDKMLATFQDAARRGIGYLAGPISFRFVASASAYLAPQQGRATMMAELDMLDGVTTGKRLLKHIKQEMCSGPEGKDVRVHWGLDLDTVQSTEVAGMFPGWPKWLSVYRLLNTTGIWNGKLTDRLGITTGSAK